MSKKYDVAWVGPFKLNPKKKPKQLFNLVEVFGFVPREIMINVVANNKFEVGAVIPGAPPSIISLDTKL